MYTSSKSPVQGLRLYVDISRTVAERRTGALMLWLLDCIAEWLTWCVEGLR